MSLEEDKPFLDRVEQLVDSIEKGTAVDVVVTLTPASGSYDDVRMGVGVVAAWGLLVFMLYSPWEFPVLSIHLGLVVVFLAGWLAGRRLHMVTRRVTSEARRRHQVDTAAAAAVHTTGMTHTIERTGLLVHISALEQMAAVIPDVGLEPAFPPAQVAKLRGALESALQGNRAQAGVLDALETLRAALAEACPPDPNPHHMPCRPRILS
ncbi:MAG TPA: hypothetical protein VGO93_07680 [Candidatus Xenobia bacterium]|jgi:uncharacterized membrane protein